MFEFWLSLIDSPFIRYFVCHVNQGTHILTVNFLDGKVKADFCCHRGTLDSAKVINLTMHRTNRGAEFPLKNVLYLIRGVGFR